MQQNVLFLHLYKKTAKFTMMKNQRLLLLLLIVLPFILTNCNKKYEPPVLTGTWAIDTSQVFFDAGWDDRLREFDNLTGSELEKRVVDSYQNMRTALKQPASINIHPNNTFDFNYVYDTDSGTYIQDGAYLTFKFTSGRYPNGLLGVSDGVQLTLLINSQDIISLMTNVVPLTTDEAAFLFEGKAPPELDLPSFNENPIIRYLEAYVAYKRTSMDY